ncbi:MAG: hypothetical protein COB66_07720 [Coxiella sp. (in: Bacteria)]|nr:MAG: hypothetical protein COB66_07720 [Coxiella sp. (in: g-proteobacteria)]
MSKYTSVFNDAFLEHTPALILWKDTLGRTRQITEYGAKFIGYASRHEVEGICDSDYRCDAAKAAEKWQQQDQKILQSHMPLTIIDIHHYTNENKLAILLTQKAILKDSNNRVFGISCMCAEIKAHLWPQIIKQLLNENTKGHHQSIQSKSIELTDGYSKYHLSIRESECLFYLLRGYSSREIAIKLELSSKRTIETYIDRIKNKLGVLTKKELISFAIDHGLLNIIPKSILMI